MSVGVHRFRFFTDRAPISYHVAPGTIFHFLSVMSQRLFPYTRIHTPRKTHAIPPSPICHDPSPEIRGFICPEYICVIHMLQIRICCSGTMFYHVTPDTLFFHYLSPMPQRPFPYTSIIRSVQPTPSHHPLYAMMRHPLGYMCALMI
jgi:hypothetical protein